MVNFQVGDKVRRKNSENNGMAVGDTGVVVDIKNFQVKQDKNGRVDGHDSDNFDLISTNINNMNLIEKAKLAMKGEPERSFIKAGVMDTNENLTKEGQELVLGWFLKKNGADFKKEVVDPILEEDKNK